MLLEGVGRKLPLEVIKAGECDKCDTEEDYDVNKILITKSLDGVRLVNDETPLQ